MNQLIDDLDTTAAPPTVQEDRIAVGEPVEVRRRFDHAWARGFVVADVGGDGYRLRRNSDGAVLPADFPRDELRRADDT